MFTLHDRGSQTSSRSLTEAKAHELDFDRSTGPLDGGELADLYAATFIIVPLAVFLKLFVL